MQAFEQQLREAGYLAMGGQIGRGKPNKAHQKDVDARWTLKIGGKIRYRPDGTPQRIHDMGAQHLPGEEVWLVGEHRSTGERKYYLSNLPPDTTMKQLAGAIKARWICEQAHQQLKEELGLDHFEGRSWTGLHRHCLMSMIAFAFLQNQRLKKAKGGKKNRRTATTTEPASHTPGNPHRARTTATITVPTLP